jgi:Na+/melibiose symporter-like transporter
VISIFAIAMDYIWPLYHDGKKFPINGQYMTFIAVICCTVSYIMISMLSRTKPFDLFGLLHRNNKIIDVPEAKKATFRLLEKLGITTEFSRGEVLLVCLMTTWSVGWCIAAIITMIYYFVFGISHKGWMNFWLVYTGMTIFLGGIVTIWFAIGGVRDLRFMFKTLATRARDYNDDGMVEQPATSARTEQAPAKEGSKIYRLKECS